MVDASTKLMGTIYDTARAAGCMAGQGRNTAGPTGHVAFWGTPVTVLRALAALGVSRDSATYAETNVGPQRSHILRDSDGVSRGRVLISGNGASADLYYALTHPMACMTA